MKIDRAHNFSRETSVAVSGPYGFFNLQYRALGKRALDVVLAIAISPVLLPVIGVLWLVTIRDGGKGFFGHTRIGRNGKAFRCWKLRTMVVDAEQKLKDYLDGNPEAALQWERDFKLEDDPRITAFGKFLRKTSLDELPQIWNVLKGEMSFVGPRPVVRNELNRYGQARHVYQSMTPGITGLWQVSGRNEISYDTRVALDVAYSQSVSFWSDTVILLKTFGAVTKLTGK